LLQVASILAAAADDRNAVELLLEHAYLREEWESGSERAEGVWAGREWGWLRDWSISGKKE
jgi:hypothetical protein